MSRGGFAAADRAHGYGGGSVTISVVVTCLMAASCGLIFGYDIGVSGGVTQMQSFLEKFFPEVLTEMKGAKRDAYCKYDNQMLTAFTSSLYIAGMLSSLVASRVTRRAGRQAVMLTGGILFLAGSVVNAAALNITMLILGRMLLGFGVGFTAQAAPLYLAETAPAKWRGAFTAAYNFFLVLGALAATVTNYFTNRIPGWGWRVSLGLAGVPATIVVLGALFVPDTPSSLVMRGHPDRARASLQRIRGADTDVSDEFKDIVIAVEEAHRNDEGAFERLRGKGYRHYLVMMVAIPTFFDLTGMIVISVFSPVLFRTVGFNSQKAILGSVILSLVNLSSVTVSTFVVDRAGRRFLFLIGGFAMMLCQFFTGIPAFVDLPQEAEDPSFFGPELNTYHRCLHGHIPERKVAFDMAATGRRFIGCPRKGRRRCRFVIWIDEPWNPVLTRALINLWSMAGQRSTDYPLRDGARTSNVTTDHGSSAEDIDNGNSIHQNAIEELNPYTATHFMPSGSFWLQTNFDVTALSAGLTLCIALVLAVLCI
uniref:Uncharacterized protein n=1 Tax=Avena sativa TaxID=4498 RepID=A0ACD5UC31_AVESA